MTKGTEPLGRTKTGRARASTLTALVVVVVLALIGGFTLLLGQGGGTPGTREGRGAAADLRDVPGVEEVSFTEGERGDGLGPRTRVPEGFTVRVGPQTDREALVGAILDAGTEHGFYPDLTTSLVGGSTVYSRVWTDGRLPFDRDGRCGPLTREQWRFALDLILDDPGILLVSCREDAEGRRAFHVDGYAPAPSDAVAAARRWEDLALPHGVRALSYSSLSGRESRPADLEEYVNWNDPAFGFEGGTVGNGRDVHRIEELMGAAGAVSSRGEVSRLTVWTDGTTAPEVTVQISHRADEDLPSSGERLTADERDAAVRTLETAREMYGDGSRVEMSVFGEIVAAYD